MDEMPRILGVDSSLTIRTTLDVVLQLAGYEVNTVADGAEALALAKSFRPALILLDAGLRAMPSAEVCRHLAADAATARVPIVLIGPADGEAQQACRDAPNVVAYLTKPFKSQTVTNLAAKVLGQAAVGDFFKTPMPTGEASPRSKTPARVTEAPRPAPAPAPEPTPSVTEAHLREALAQMDALAHNALTLRAQLETENRTAEKRARQAQAEAERSRAQAEQLDRDNVELTAQLDEAHSRLADLETESGIYTAELQRVEQERAQEHALDAQRLRTDAHRREADAQRLATLEAELADVRAQLEFLGGAAAARQADFAQELVELRTHTATVEQTLNRVSAERAGVQSALDAARQQLAHEAQIRSEQMNRLTQLEAVGQELIDHLAAARAHETELTRTLDNLHHEHNRQRFESDAHLGTLAERLADQQRRLARVEADLAAARTAHAEAARAWQATTAQREADQELARAEWTQQLQAEQAQLSAARREAPALAARVAELEAERATTQQQRVELERGLTAARVDSTRREAGLERLHQQIDSFEEQAATWEAIRRGLIDRTATLEAELHHGETALEAACTESARRLETAHAQAKAAQGQVVAANAQLQALTAERAAAQQQCTAAEQELATARGELEQQRTATELAQSQLRQLHDQVAAGETAARESVARLAALEAERQARATRITELEQLYAAEADAVSIWQARATERETEQEAARAEWTRQLEAAQAQAKAARGRVAAGEVAARESAARLATLEAERHARATRITELEQLHAAQAEDAHVWQARATERETELEVVRAEWTRQLEAAQAQAKAAQGRVAAVSGHLQALTAERATAQQQCTAAEQELATARGALEQQRAATELAQSQLRQLHDQVAAGETAARESVARLAALEAERQARATRITELEQLHATQAEDAHVWQARAAEREAELEAARAEWTRQLETAHAQAKAAQAQVAAVNGQLQALTAERATAQQQCTAAEQELATARGALEQQRTTTELAQSQLRQLHDQVAAGETAARESAARLATLEAERHARASRITELEQLHAAQAEDAHVWQARAAEREAELEATRSEWTRQLEATQAKAKAAQGRVAAVNGQLQALTAERATAQQQCTAAEQQLATARGELEQQRATTEGTQSQLRQLHDQVAAGETAARESVARLAALEAERHTRATRITELEQLHAAEADAVYIWQARAAERELELEAVRAEWPQRLANEQAQVAHALDEIGRLSERIQALDAELGVAARRHTEIERNLIAVRGKLDQQRGAAQKAERQVHKLDSELAERDARIAQMAHTRAAEAEALRSWQQTAEQAQSELEAARTSWTQQWNEEQARSAAIVDQLRDLAADRDAADAGGAALTRELIAARGLLAEKQAAAERTQAQLRLVEEQLGTREASGRELGDRLAALRVELSERDGRIAEIDTTRAAEAEAFRSWRDTAIQREAELVRARDEVTRALEAEGAGAVALSDRLRSLDAERSAGAQQRAEAERDVETTRNELVLRIAAFETASEQIRELEAQLSARDAAGGELSARLDAAHAQLEGLNNRVEQLAVERQATEQRRHALKQQLTTAQSQLTLGQAELAATRAEIDLLTEQSTTREAASQELADRVTLLEAELDARHALIAETEHLRAAEAEESRASQATAAERQAGWQAAHARWEQELAAERAQTIAAREQATARDDQVRHLISERDALEHNCETVRQQLIATQRELAGTRDMTADAQARLHTLAEQIGAGEAAGLDLTVRLAAREGELHERDGQLAEMTQQYAATKNALETVRNKLSQNRTVFEKTEARLHAFEERVIAREAAARDLTARVTTQAAELRERETLLAKARDQVSPREQRYAEETERIIVAARRREDELRTTVQALQRQLDAVREEPVIKPASIAATKSQTSALQQPLRARTGELPNAEQPDITPPVAAAANKPPAAATAPPTRGSVPARTGRLPNEATRLQRAQVAFLTTKISQIDPQFIQATQPHAFPHLPLSIAAANLKPLPEGISQATEQPSRLARGAQRLLALLGVGRKRQQHGERPDIDRQI